MEQIVFDVVRSRRDGSDSRRSSDCDGSSDFVGSGSYYGAGIGCAENGGNARELSHGRVRVPP